MGASPADGTRAALSPWPLAPRTLPTAEDRPWLRPLVAQPAPQFLWGRGGQSWSCVETLGWGSEWANSAPKRGFQARSVCAGFVAPPGEPSLSRGQGTSSEPPTDWKLIVRSHRGDQQVSSLGGGPTWSKRVYWSVQDVTESKKSRTEQRKPNTAGVARGTWQGQQTCPQTHPAKDQGNMGKASAPFKCRSFVSKNLNISLCIYLQTL